VRTEIRLLPSQRHLLEALASDGDGYKRAYQETYHARLRATLPYRNVTLRAKPLVSAGLIEVVPNLNGWRFGLRITDAGRKVIAP
jgi:DNA-binding MarR family transcriptional regulator